jgi:hypothetical protein
MAYVCETLNTATNQCDSWISTLTLTDFAITSSQSAELCIAIASFYSICWILKKSRYAVK